VRNGCRADFEVLLGAGGWQGGDGTGGGWGGSTGGGSTGGGWGDGNQGGPYPGGGIPGAGGRPIAVINCQSFNYRQAVCAIPRARAVQLSRVLGGDCQQGRTWTWTPGQITVNNGCRAAFDIY